VISKDVKVYESEAWDWSEKERSSNLTIPALIEE